MVHAASLTFKRFEHMSPPAAVAALLLHVIVALLFFWAPVHRPPVEEPTIEVTMEPPPKSEPKPPEAKPPEPPKPEPPKPPPPKPQQTPLPGLAPPGPVGEKSTAPPMARGETTRELPQQKAEEPKPKEEPAAAPTPPQQAMARPTEPQPPPPAPPTPTLEQELPPVAAPPQPLTSRDIPKPTPVPERKPEPPKPEPPRQAPQPPHPQVQPQRPAPPQLQPSPLSRLPRNAPSQQRQTEQPRSTFVNPADLYAQNSALDAYLQRVVYQVSRFRFDGQGLSPTDAVVVRFTISRNGSLLAVSIARPSGKPKLDREAITAFQQVAPFPPLPAEVMTDSHTFLLTFFPGRAR